MQIGMIGLGRMGSNIVRRLARGNHTAVVYDLDPKTLAALADEGQRAHRAWKTSSANSIGRVLRGLCFPPGMPPSSAVRQLSELLEPGDVIIDSGNSFWRDDIRRSKTLKSKGIDYVDVGTSGGVWGLDRGYCMADRRRQGRRAAPRSHFQNACSRRRRYSAHSRPKRQAGRCGRRIHPRRA